MKKVLEGTRVKSRNLTFYYVAILRCLPDDLQRLLPCDIHPGRRVPLWGSGWWTPPLKPLFRAGLRQHWQPGLPSTACSGRRWWWSRTGQGTASWKKVGAHVLMSWFFIERQSMNILRMQNWHVTHSLKTIHRIFASHVQTLNGSRLLNLMSHHRFRLS